jgi:hypothetical protein
MDVVFARVQPARTRTLRTDLMRPTQWRGASADPGT